MSQTHTHAPPTIHKKKSKQELSECSEFCLMQLDERCCHVVKSWSLWSWQVRLSNNKSRPQEWPLYSSVRMDRRIEGLRKSVKMKQYKRGQHKITDSSKQCKGLNDREKPKKVCGKAVWKKYINNMVVTRLEEWKETWCIASGHAAWMVSAAASPTTDASEPESWSQLQHTLEQSNKDSI